MEKLRPVPMPSKEVLSVFPPNQRERIVYDVSVANGTVEQYSKIRAWNWRDQQAALASIDIEANPVAEAVRTNVAKMVAKAQEEQTSDPAGWQRRNDPEFIRVPPNETPLERTARLNRMIGLQGAPPQKENPTPEDLEQAKRYLNLSSGLWNAISVGEATERARTLNNMPPNQRTQAIEAFNAEFPDTRIRAMAWNDMQNLPSGQDRLQMGIRVAEAIHNQQVRNRFIGAMNPATPLKPKEPASMFEKELNGNQTYRRFVTGWVGDGNQRAEELKEFNDSIQRYAMWIATTKETDAGTAIEEAVKHVIDDNYGFMSVNGRDVPVYLHPHGGSYSPRDIELINAGIQEALLRIETRQISDDPFHFPLAPVLPGDQTERDTYLKRLLTSATTVVVEPEGNSATIYVQGEGEADVAFQLRRPDGSPFVLDFETMKVRGEMADKARALLAPPSIQQMSDPAYMKKRDETIDAMKAESYRRLGIDPKTGRKEIKLAPAQRSTELDYGTKP